MEWAGWAVAALASCLAIVSAWQAHRHRQRLDRLQVVAQREATATRVLAASDERARIAREMHDVVAHTLSVVVAQADGGRFAARADPAAGERTLDTIANVSRTALEEMRALLGVLRAPEGDIPLGPQPSIGDIPALVASARESGLEAAFVTTGTPRPLPLGAGLALYRIAQEAVTNVLKHAGPTANVYVQLRWEDDRVTLVVRDDGRGAAAHGDGRGQGIEGMRERATVFGGTLTAGPQVGGGFEVQAVLPLPDRQEDTQ